MPTIKANLKKYRKEKGWTQEELAKKLNVTRQTINAIEQSKYQPSLFLAYQCSVIFDVDINSLFTFE